MDTSTQHSEHPSTYFVQDRANQEECQRLLVQNHMLTAAIGGALPEQTDLFFRRVLDVGCGTGGWLIELAQSPQCPPDAILYGIDISKQMVLFAQEQARMLGDRIIFVPMDALRMLEFPGGFFDLVNLRLVGSWMRTWEWPKLLQECQRVCQSGGIIRVTEVAFCPITTSPALNQLFQLALTAFSNAGHLFQAESQGLINELPGLMKRHGIEFIQTHIAGLEYRADLPQWEPFVENIRRLFRIIIPFLHKWIRVPEEYEELYQQAMKEIQYPHFIAKATCVTAWGVGNPKSDRVY